jgi:hypothetical protein
MAFTNMREREHARNLSRVVAAAPGEPRVEYHVRPGRHDRGAGPEQRTDFAAGHDPCRRRSRCQDRGPTTRVRVPVLTEPKPLRLYPPVLPVVRDDLLDKGTVHRPAEGCHDWERNSASARRR